MVSDWTAIRMGCIARTGRLVTLFCFVLECGCGGEPDQLNGGSAAPESKSASLVLATNDRENAKDVITNLLGMSLVFIPSGQFQMGTAEPERFGKYSQCEGPIHSVGLSRDFRISQHEVTVRQFRIFVEKSGYLTEAERTGLGCNGLDLTAGKVVRRPDCVWRSPGFLQTDQHPVVCVSWNDACEFCQWLSDCTGQHYRLPTEAEWEYCCRAGTKTFLSTGKAPESLQSAGNAGDHSLQSQCPVLTSVAGWDDGFPFTAPVGSFQPNAFGLCDMHGNVGEWCLDWFDSDYYSVSPAVDPAGPEANQQWRVVRGGSWYNHPVSCRSSGRHDGVPTEASTTNGFRVLMEIPLLDEIADRSQGGANSVVP